MVAKLISSLLVLAFASFLTGTLLPSGDVPKQLMAAAIWFLAGVFVTLIVSHRAT